jgi:hypothetical protein
VGVVSTCSPIWRAGAGSGAQFSTVVDDFTALNMTESEAEEVIIYDAIEYAKIEARRAIAYAKQQSRADRWEECLHTIEEIHGPEAAKERRQEAKATG